MKSVCRRLLWLLVLCAGAFPIWAAATGYKLAITPAGNKVILSWPVAATNYLLESTPTLAAPNWQTVANPWVPANNTNFVTYTNNSPTRFFRLSLGSTGFYLAISRSNNTVVVFWPAAATNYVLQSTFSLSPANWLTVTSPVPATISTTNFVTYTNVSLSRFFRLYLNTNTVSTFAGMVQIPAGAFTMGNASGDGDITDAATVSATLSAFYMDTNLVNYTLWQTVYNYGTGAGYGFANGGSGQGASQPVQTVDWYDAVKWCNARSQQAGLTPAYYTDAGLTQVYTNGETDGVYVNWAGTGYRLPTEAEWEKAARGGLSGKRFPLGDTISENQANYYGDTSKSYDLGPNGYNFQFQFNGFPYTSPVGRFAPNGYGLYDMAGNVDQWCWDWYGTPYAGGTDPHGPGADSGSGRVLRGGDWSYYATNLRCAARTASTPSIALSGTYGFRCVRGH